MIIPKKIDCIEIVKYGGPDNLVIKKRDTPQIGKNELLVKVEAAGVNRPDIMQRQGLYPPPPGASDIPGLEIAGKIVAVNSKDNKFKIGDNVCALVSGGGYSSYCVAPIKQTLPIPKGLSFIEAAAIPETFFTVWANVFDRGNLKINDKILIHGGASGIGTTAIQLAKSFGAKVYTTVGSDEKCKIMNKLGAELAINYNKNDFEKKIDQMAVITSQEDVTNISGVPSWMLVLFHKILEKTGVDIETNSLNITLAIAVPKSDKINI